MKILGQGAEATIYLAENNDVIKERISKSYRLPQIDSKLRRQRTRREAKIMKNLQESNIAGPKLKSLDDKKMTITMDFLNGPKVRDILTGNAQVLSAEIGRKIGLLHSQGIIHSDLTTSNMIFENEVKIIDFGLSFFSSKIEDKAVDLHLFKQALESKHHEISDDCFKFAIEGYKETCDNANEVIKRLEIVQKRGRNKIK